MQSTTHISTSSIIKQKEQLFRGLESELQTNNEWMSGICEYITLSLSIFDKILSHYLLLIQDFHRVQSTGLDFRPISQYV